MSGSLFLHNRQRRHPIDIRHLRKITRSLLVEDLQTEDFELGIFLVSEPEMVHMNEGYLRHAGSTDVITFDYCGPGFFAGDIFVCVDEAVVQARKFKTSWQSEIVRYIVHGILHLRGHDDARTDTRRRMKLAEDKLLRALSARFNVRQIGRPVRSTK